MEFWSQLNARPLISHDEAFHALLLYLDNTDPAADYAGRVQALTSRGLLPDGFNRPAEEALGRGTLAVALAKTLGIKGGLTMQLTGASPRYAVRALQYRNLYPPSSPNQTFSGAEFVGVMGKVEDYQRGDPANSPAAFLPGEIDGKSAALIPAPTDTGPAAEISPEEPGGPTRPLMLNMLNASANLWWQDAATQPTTGPAATQRAAPTPQNPVKLKVIITGVEGPLVEVRKSETDPWVRARVGMSLGEAAEFRTGPKSAVRFVIPPDQVFTLDRQGTVKVLQAVYDGKKVTADVGMNQGRVRLDVAPIAKPIPQTDEPVYRIEEAGIEHDSTIRSPNTALAVRGTLVSLFDQAPFAPEAVSLTGRAIFRNTRRELIAFGGAGQGKTTVQGNQTGAGQHAYARSTLSPNSEAARNDFLTREAALVLDRGGLIRGDVVVNPTPITEQELVPILPGYLNFVLQWGAAGRPLEDLNLSVFSPVHAKPTADFVANPPFTISLVPQDPTAVQLRRNSGQISAAELANPPPSGLYPRTSATGGQIGRNGVGPAGLEVASWSRNYPVGTYQVIVYNLIDANQSTPVETVNPVDYTVTVYLNGQKFATTPTLSVGQLQTSEPILVRVPAPDTVTTASASSARPRVIQVGPATALRRPGGTRASGAAAPPARIR